MPSLKEIWQDKWIRLFVWIALVIFLGFALVMIRLPYYIIKPGGARSVEDYVKVERKVPKNVNPGEYDLVYVTVTRATPWTYLTSYFNQDATRVPKSEVDQNYSPRQTRNRDTNEMFQSFETAQYVALKKAGIPCKIHNLGMGVEAVSPKSNFKDKVAPGDLIIAVNGHHYKSAKGYIKAMVTDKEPKKVTLTLQELIPSGFTMKETAKQMLLSKKYHLYGLGIVCRPQFYVTSKVEISPKMQGLGGPSAGLMMTLQIYSRLKPLNLKPHTKIAGTGTINPNGTVGPIGGVTKKIISADQAGAQVFFVPAAKLPKEPSNYQQAKEVAKKRHLKIKVVPVKTADQAINYLNQHYAK